MSFMLCPLVSCGRDISQPDSVQAWLLCHLWYIIRDTPVGGWHFIAFVQWRPWYTWCVDVVPLHPTPPNRKLRPLPVMRIGEAANPGPIVLVANVTSMASAWCDLVALKWDVAMIQEARVGPNHRVMSEAREARIGVFLGPLDEDGVALVAFLVRQGHATNIAECQHLRCTGLLWQHFGCTPIRLYNLYGDATGSLDGKLETGALARSALVDAEGAGAVPSVLAGDFNMTFAELPCLHALVASNWHDLGSSVTSAPSHGCSRRIDLLIANAGARSVGTSTRVDWSFGMPTHAAQYIDISDSPAPS